MQDPFSIRKPSPVEPTPRPEGETASSRLSDIMKLVLGGAADGKTYTHTFTPSDRFDSWADEYGEIHYDTGDVQVPCQHCDTLLVRAQYPPFDWQHKDDEVIIREGVVIQGSAYDHRPTLAVIDVE